MTVSRTVTVDGLDIFYREAGSPDAQTILLLHGFPTSSHMFRNLMPALADRFHLVAPDYPGFGYSSMPAVDEFDYTFDHLAEVMTGFIDAIGLKRYSLYLMDYGAPIGYRIAAKNPERVESLIVQNGNAYEEGLGDFWKPMRAYWQHKTPENAERVRQTMTVDATKRYYTTGARNLENLSPDTWTLDQALLNRPGNLDIQLALKYSYQSNLLLYPQWQAYLRQHQPPTLVVWGKNDRGFLVEGAYAYKRDLQNLEFHLFDTGHFALEEDGDAIADHIRRFMTTHVGERVLLKAGVI
ncbi:alpha/beta fold hydrolase [Leptolyngbya sp. FACHB-261]|uniref:alpha/beta fold hydrolase n=1 Tax=Leptolyngbya sp. FACHB-261 TaxID=2692806 RepID=UPI0016859BA2|nr:alpha/beta fold hydrolase [Leptolyngbya sp. FACHB-261]MBD2100361.1 alpha/beta hydrolase [Leptolyngbya sp. FACHB-261]